MKFLHIAMGMPEFDKALKDRGHKVSRYNWREAMATGKNLAEVNSEIEKLTKEQKPDVVFMQLQTAGIIEARTIETLRKMGAFVVNWTGDVREDIDWYRNLAPYFNVTLFTNQTDVDTLRDEGLSADFLQIGYDDDIYNYKEVKRAGVVFLGNHYPNRFPESSTRERMISHYQLKGLKAYGKGWQGCARITSASVEVATYHRAQFALNIDHFNRPKFYSDRVLRAQACGAIICQMSEIKMDDHPFTLYGYPEVQELPESYHRMVAEYTRDNHTWRNRVDDLVKIIE